MKFKRRHGEFKQGCVLSESYRATDALPLILPACRQPLLPACVFITRGTVRHPRLFVQKICSWWQAFMNWSVRDQRHSWTEVPLYFKFKNKTNFQINKFKLLRKMTGNWMNNCNIFKVLNSWQRQPISLLTPCTKNLAMPPFGTD
jgi:hypothetical protein